MKGVPVLLAYVLLLLGGCARTLTPDLESTVQLAVAATLTAQPTETPSEIPTFTPTLDVASTVRAAVAATQTAQPAKSTATPYPPTPTDTATHTPTPAATLTRVPPSIQTRAPFELALKTYQGEGFSFRYPAHARIKKVTLNDRARGAAPTATGDIRVVGSQIWVRTADPDRPVHPTVPYVLIVRTYPNPEGLDAESWARQYIVASWEWAREKRRPWVHLPISEEGEIDEGRVGNRVVAGEPAYWVGYHGFDSGIYAYYLDAGTQIVELRFQLNLPVNEPLALVADDVYALILATLHLEKG